MQAGKVVRARLNPSRERAARLVEHRGFVPSRATPWDAMRRRPSRGLPCRMWLVASAAPGE